MKKKLTESQRMLMMNRFLNELNERGRGDPNSVEAHGPKMSPPKNPIKKKNYTTPSDDDDFSKHIRGYKSPKSKIRERVKVSKSMELEGCGGGYGGCSGNIIYNPPKPRTAAQKKREAEANKNRAEAKAKEQAHDKRKMVKKVATPKRKKTITKNDRKYGGR